jgi:hypothetical protein
LKHVRGRGHDIGWRRLVGCRHRRGAHVRRGRCLVSRELRFFGFLDVDQVSRDHPFGFAFSQRLALLEPQRAVAELLDEVE